MERSGEKAVPDRNDTDDEPCMASQPHQASAGPGESCQKSTLVAASVQICQAPRNECLACKADAVPATSTISLFWC